MENKKQTPKRVELRKLLLVAPLLAVPMLALIFHSLGGGKGVPAAGPGAQRGVNMTLPMAQLNTKGKPQDKMDLYATAAQDSAKLLEKRKQDPYAVVADSTQLNGMPAGKRLQTGTSAQQQAADRQADRVLQRLAQIKTMMGANPPPPTHESRIRSNTDPQMARLDAMLDKLIKIQHPDLVGRDIGPAPGAPSNLLEQPAKEVSVRVLGDAPNESTGFIEIGSNDAPDSGHAGHEQAIEAMVNGDQTLTAGATVALRLAQEAAINGVKIPAGQPVYGLASLSGERLLVNINSLRVGQTLVSVSLQVYDLDGLPGIRVPGTVTRDLSKESASEALGGLGIASLDPNLGAQAASAGLQFAKSLASHKVRLVRVSLPAGYRVLLKNTKSITHQ